MNVLDRRIEEVTEKMSEINRMAKEMGLKFDERNRVLIAMGEEVEMDSVQGRYVTMRIPVKEMFDKFGDNTFFTCESWKHGQIITLLGPYSGNIIRGSDASESLEKDIKFDLEWGVEDVGEWYVWMSNLPIYKKGTISPIPGKNKIGVISPNSGWGGNGKVYVYRFERNKGGFLNWNDNPLEVK